MSRFFVVCFPGCSTCWYLSGLIVSENVTLTGVTGRFVEAPGQSALNRFLTASKWSADDVNELRLQLLQEHSETRWGKRGVIAIDDVIIEKTGRRIEGVGKLYDHSEGRFVYGHNLVTSHYADDRVQYPLDLRQYRKKDDPGITDSEFKTKIELAKELVDAAVARGVPGAFVFDTRVHGPRTSCAHRSVRPRLGVALQKQPAGAGRKPLHADMRVCHDTTPRILPQSGRKRQPVLGVFQNTAHAQPRQSPNRHILRQPRPHRKTSLLGHQPQGPGGQTHTHHLHSAPQHRNLP